MTLEGRAVRGQGHRAHRERRHHIEEEEQDWFPKVREGLTRTQLREIGAELAAAKEKAPRRPEQPSALKKTLDAVIA